MRGGIGHQLECKRQQRIAGEDGGRFVILAMQRRTAAAEIVIVHGRQIVMHEAVSVHAFDCARGAQQGAFVGVEDPPGFEREERTQPLAATESSVPNGVQQARLRPLLTGQEPVEGGMDPLGGVLQARFKLGHGALPLTERPAGASTPYWLWAPGRCAVALYCDT